MIVIGERLNSTRRPVLEAFEKRDEDFLCSEAARQKEAGADYIDLNAAALMEGEIPALEWAVSLLQKTSPLLLSIDSPNPEAIEAGLKIHKGRAFLNSLTAEKRRLKRLLPVIREFKPRVIALCLDDCGIPENEARAVDVAAKLFDALTDAGLAPGDIFFDPLVRPVAAEMAVIGQFLSALEKIRLKFPEAGTVAGLSNVSFGLPQRKLLNRTLLILALGRGLQAAICDPLDDELKASLFAAQALLGQDPSMKIFLKYARSQNKK